MTTQYPSGADLSEIFPTLEKRHIPIPDLFDKNCKKCGAMREDVTHIMPFRTRRRPFAALRCPKCGKRVLFFEAPRIPFILTEDEFPKGYEDSTGFSEYIDYLIEKREREHAENEIHELSAINPEVLAAVLAKGKRESPSS